MPLSRFIRAPFILVATTALLSSACAANQHNVGIGGTVGTTGVTIEGKYAVSNHIALRGTIGTVPVSTNQSFDGVDYEADVNMTTFGGFADLYPFRNSGFNISGGVYGGEKSVDLVGVPGPATTVDIGNTTYTGAQIGTLRGDVQYADVAPFIGIGYDGFMNHDRLWSFNAKAGVMFIGDPDVNLTAEGGLASMFPAVQDDLEREAQNLEDELDQYKYYPVISLGVTRRF